MAVVSAVSRPGDRTGVGMSGLTINFAGSISLGHRRINGASEGGVISGAGERNIDSYLIRTAQQ
jgi:hypothetical protein